MQQESHFFRSPEDERTILPRLSRPEARRRKRRKREGRKEERVLRDSEGGGIPFGYVVCDPQRCVYVLHDYSMPE